MQKIQANDLVFRYYFYFIQERMEIFWRRYKGQNSKLTEDPILAKHKFTNVYRVLDRVSQYLVKEVIYGNGQSENERDILLRILVFKIFNNIETWIFLKEHYGEITVKSFNVSVISKLLSERIKHVPIFSAAYMMTGSHEKYQSFSSKHERWLSMVQQEIIKEGRIDKILVAKSLEEIYLLLRECSFIGPFIAYQYTVDLNYSNVIDFDEDSFVVAGIGSIRGIKKCFGNTSASFEDCIRYTQDNFEKYQEKYGFKNFKTLLGRPPKLIDLQNCFCETDKYLRAKMPDLLVGNTRIKQKFSSPKGKINFFFPPKWGINQSIEQCTLSNIPELTLF